MKINCQVRQASSNVDARHYDTQRIRQEYLVENLMVPDEINLAQAIEQSLFVLLPDAGANQGSKSAANDDGTGIDNCS